jgi:hypothetical protein
MRNDYTMRNFLPQNSWKWAAAELKPCPNDRDRLPLELQAENS